MRCLHAASRHIGATLTSAMVPLQYTSPPAVAFDAPMLPQLPPPVAAIASPPVSAPRQARVCGGWSCYRGCARSRPAAPLNTLQAACRHRHRHHRSRRSKARWCRWVLFVGVSAARVRSTVLRAELRDSITFRGGYCLCCQHVPAIGRCAHGHVPGACDAFRRFMSDVRTRMCHARVLRFAATDIAALEGEAMLVLAVQFDGWCLVRVANGAEGMFPSSYMQLC